MSMESGSPDPDPSRSPLHPPTDEQITFESSTSGSQTSETEGKSSGSESNSREHTDGSAQMTENTRKRKSCSKDSKQVKTGNEGSSRSEKRQKTPATNNEPEANGHREPQHTNPPPLRKSLVVFLRATSEAVCGDIAQLQAQQRRSLLTQEQLRELTQLSGSLSAMAQTFYSLAHQAAFAFPAEGWLVPAPMADPQELSGNDSQSSSLEEGQITDTASPSDKS